MSAYSNRHRQGGGTDRELAAQGAQLLHQFECLNIIQNMCSPKGGHCQGGQDANAVVTSGNVGNLHGRLRVAGGEEGGGQAGQSGALHHRFLQPSQTRIALMRVTQGAQGLGPAWAQSPTDQRPLEDPRSVCHTGKRTCTVCLLAWARTSSRWGLWTRAATEALPASREGAAATAAILR